MPKILFIDSNHPVLHETLMQHGFQCDLFYDRPSDELKKLISQYDGIVIRSKFKITKEIIDSAPNLRCIGRVGAGMENMDLAYAESKGIACLNSPEGNRDAVAEHALGMLLMLFNKLNKADAEVRKGIWLREENRGIELCGKKVGIIGYGNMGKAFAQRLKGFEVNVLAYDKYKKGFGNDFVKEVPLEELFEKVDVLSLHIPLTKETEYLVNDAFINSFSKNIYLINTARGKCVDTKALVKGLQSGKVQGACLDVLEYEDISFEKLNEAFAAKTPGLEYLISSDKVVLSPHIAGWTKESHVKLAKFLAEKIIHAFNYQAGSI